MFDGHDGDQRPLSRREINEIAAELRSVRVELTQDLAHVLELSNRFTDLVVRLLRAVG